MSKPFGNGGETRLTKQIKCHRPHNSKVGRGIAITQGSCVLLENHIFGPMQPIFDVPMPLNLCRKASRIQAQRTNIKDCFLKRLVGTDTLSLHLNQALHANPLGVNSCNGIEDTHRALGLTVTRVLGLTIHATRQCLFKLAFEMFKQRGLIAFDGN